MIDVQRRYLATYDFRHTMLVVVVGPDGLVANTAKSVGDLPIVAINPDPARIDGELLPFKIRDARSVVQRTLDHNTRRDLQRQDRKRLFGVQWRCDRRDHRRPPKNHDWSFPIFF